MGKNQFSYLLEGTNFEGELSVPHDMRIDGIFTGSIECGNTLIIGKSGEVKAKVTAKNLEVAGKIVGNISCDKRVELMEKSSVIGNITAKELIINQGAIFHGSSAMLDEKHMPKGVEIPEPEITLEEI